MTNRKSATDFPASYTLYLKKTFPPLNSL